ncbi:beta strand repeat-containing protein [Mucilaginibacter gotjawali]|uniref:beta strand repeat-containing protein n=1 Tax=Mucilaginibacter gotjawali TaxID=1550579 RepID=UPI0012FD6F4A|nr:hypothetical protein [Mucilaginibacter gotjawali]
MVDRFLLTLIIVLGWCSTQAAITFDWKGTSTTWAASTSWTENGGTGDYPGSGGRTTDVVRFGMSGTFSSQPTLTSSITIASIEFGGGYQTAGTQLTVNGATLTVTTITQDINTTSGGFTIYDYLQGTGTITCTNINVGSGSSTSGTNNFMLSDIATLNVSGNVTITTNANIQNGCGFRLESGNMYLTGQVIFNKLTGINASNSAYFTINTVTQSGGTATTPHLYLSNANPLGTIPSPYASVNFYGDHGGTSTVTYTAASPKIYTTATAGFGSGGGTIDTTKASYDYLTIQGSGTATVGGSTVGALKVTGDLTTNSPVTFAPAGASATNTSVGGNWNNTSTVTGGAGTFAITGNVANSGPMTLSSGNLDVGSSLTNSSTITAGSGSIIVDAGLSTSGTLTLSSGALKVGGNYTNSGTFTAGTGTVYFNGASAQSLTDNSSAGTTLNNCDFSGAGTKTLSGTGKFAVSSSGVLTMEASTTLQTGGILTLNSASTGSATVGAIPSTSSITGTVNVQRYISGGSNTYRSYRLLSSPVYTATSGSIHYSDLSYLPLYSPITGTLGTGGGMTKSGNPSMYLYRDNMAFTNSTFNTGNFRGINKINNSPLYAVGVDYDGTYNLTVGTGIMFFYRGDLTNLANKFTTTTSAEATVLSSTGTLNQQAVTVTNWYTGLTTLQCSTVTGNTGYSGYNLVGNPYASSIDWNTYSTTTSTAGIYAPSVGPTIYVFNPVTKVYATYSGGVGLNGGSNIIPSGQGFFVKASSSSAQLIFHESAKTNSQLTGPTAASGTTLLLSTAPIQSSVLQYLRINLAADTIEKEETIVRFDNSSKTTYDINEDAQYLPGSGRISLSSMTADSVPVAINNMPLPKRTQSIKLVVKTAADGQFTLNMTELKSIPQLFQVWLKDAYNKDSLDFRHNPIYTFDVLHSDTNSFGANRFSLVIRQDPALMIHLLSFGASKTSNGSQVVWNTENEQNYTNFTVERSNDGGVTFAVLGGVSSDTQGTYSFLDKNPPLATDMYRLKIQDINGSITYSNVVTLIYGNATTNVAKSNISIYPNPSNGIINLAITAGGILYR